jgi:hypothetical protein
MGERFNGKLHKFVLQASFTQVLITGLDVDEESKNLYFWNDATWIGVKE